MHRHGIGSRAHLPIEPVLAILRALRDGPRSRAELLRRARISRASFYRHLEYMSMIGVIVELDEDLGQYVVRDWGVINRRAL